jgi:hypothetical protein
MKDLKISKELLSEVLNLNITYIERCNNSIIYKVSVYDREEEVNIYEFVYLNLKQWAKLNNVFDKIDWSEEPEQIFKKAEEFRNEIN